MPHTSWLTQGVIPNTLVSTSGTLFKSVETSHHVATTASMLRRGRHDFFSIKLNISKRMYKITQITTKFYKTVLFKYFTTQYSRTKQKEEVRMHVHMQ